MPRQRDSGQLDVKSWARSLRWVSAVWLAASAACGNPTATSAGAATDTAGAGADAAADGHDAVTDATPAADVAVAEGVGNDAPAADVKPADAAATDAAATDSKPADAKDAGPDATAGCNVKDDCNIGLPVCKKGHCDPGSGLCVIEDAGGSCDDGDPCTEADQCLVGGCVGFAIAGCCTKDCKGKVCGGDGCGGTCGACATGQVCGNGVCVQATAPGETCADALAIAQLPFVHVGSTLGKKNDLLAPDQACYNASLGTYGPDVTYTYTPSADGTLGIKLEGYANKPAFYVVTDCADTKNSCLTGSLGYGQDTLENWAKVKKGKPIYIVVDADLDGGDYTLHVTTCAPQCAGKVCGYDGCGGDCGFCKKFSNEACSTAGTCVCLPSCDAKACGSNGCGGSCGSCPSGKVCDASGQGCVSTANTGDTCSNATAITTSPFSVTAGTAGLGNDVYAWASCQGKGTGAYWGYSAPDAIYALGGGASQTWLLELTNISTSLEFYALTDCKDPLSCAQGAYEPASLKKQLFVETPLGAPLFVAVDGYDDQVGTYTLTATHCAAPGDCSNGDPGEYCSYPVVVEALPFAYSGSGSLDSYQVAAGTCGNVKALGDGGSDRAFALVAQKSGTYTFAVKASGGADKLLYATKDCTHLATTCIGFVDKTGADGSETLQVQANAGETLYVVVDSVTAITGSFSLNVTGP